MPVDTYGGNTGVSGKKLYVLSSCDGQEDCGTQTNLFFGFYDPATDTWIRLANPPGLAAHQFGASAVIGGKFYAVGGDGSKAVEVYDPCTGRWSTKAAMGSLRTGVASAAVGGKMYVIAGTRVDFGRPEDPIRFTPVATTSVYDPATDTWMNLKPAPRSGSGRAGGRVVVNGQPRVALAGRDQATTSNSCPDGSGSGDDDQERSADRDEILDQGDREVGHTERANESGAGSVATERPDHCAQPARHRA